MLAEMPEVTELHPVPDAHVPVLQFKFSGVSIDLLYAKLSIWVIPEVSVDFILETGSVHLNMHPFTSILLSLSIFYSCII